MKWWFSVVLCMVVAQAWAQADVALVATVDGQSISQAELDTAVYVESRQRFYHGRIDAPEMLSLRVEVLRDLIDRVLLLGEAQRLELVVGEEAKSALVASLRQNYNVSAMPEDHRLQLDGLLARQAQEQLLLQALEARVRGVGEPDAKALDVFYNANQDKFTTPPRLRLSVILLKVQPSAPVAAWEAAEREAVQIRAKLMSGADFSELAEMHSGDSSGENGGSLGYVHQGMLSEEAQQAVDKLAVGEISEVVVLLQGVALFRLDERQEASLNPLVDVKERATGLWQREQGELAWQALLNRLRASADVDVLDSQLSAKIN